MKELQMEYTEAEILQIIWSEWGRGEGDKIEKEVADKESERECHEGDKARELALSKRNQQKCLSRTNNKFLKRKKVVASCGEQRRQRNTYSYEDRQETTWIKNV